MKHYTLKQLTAAKTLAIASLGAGPAKQKRKRGMIKKNSFPP